MPKLGMQPVRTSALVEAVIAEVGETGTMDVTVSRIAQRAGMSPALAHHYFGSKNRMFTAAMRHILTEYGREIRDALHGETDPHRRLEIIIRTSFSEINMHPETVTAWLNFYVFARKSDDIARLLQIYRQRLRSNLLFDLRKIDPAGATRIAEAIASMIDGAYIRSGLRKDGDPRHPPEEIALDYLALALARDAAATGKDAS